MGLLLWIAKQILHTNIPCVLACPLRGPSMRCMNSISPYVDFGSFQLSFSCPTATVRATLWKIFQIIASMGSSQNMGYLLFRGPHSKDYSIFGFILGSPNFGKLVGNMPSL